MIYALFIRIWKNDSLIWQQASLQIYAQFITSLFRTKLHGIFNSLENFEDQIWALWTRRKKNSEQYKAWREQLRGKTWTWNLKLTWTFENALRLISAIVFNKCIEMEMCVLRTDHLPPIILSSNICQIWRKKHVATVTTVTQRCLQVPDFFKTIFW